jgi:hypothetical protein
MLWDIVTFGGLLFWSIVGIVALVITTQVHEEKVGWAAFTLLAAVAAVVALTNTVKLLAGIPPIYYLYGFLGYLGVAALWATIKWRAFFLPALFEKYEELRYNFLKRKGLDEMPADPAVRKEFNDQHDVARLDVNYNRMVRHNKGRITTWMVFWPFSLLETFLGDFLVRVFNTIYKTLAGMLQRMSDGMASKYSELN